MATTEADVIARYIEFRDYVHREDALHEERMKPYKMQMEQIESHFLGLMNRRNINSLSTPLGTAYRSRIIKPVLTDRAALVSHVQRTGEFEVFTNAVSKPFVQEHLDKYDVPPPGIEVNAFVTARFKRP